MRASTIHQSLAWTLARAAGGLALSAGCLCATAAAAIEEVLTPASYFECQIAAQEATLVGLQERASEIGTNMTELERQAAGELARSRVTLALYACGRQNASTMGAYASRNAEAIKSWLVANPQVQARLEASNGRIASLSAQMPANTPTPAPAPVPAPAAPPLGKR